MKTNQPKKSTMIFIEGNVGVGKSTFLNFLKKAFDASVLYEPSQLWQDVDGYNLLEQFFLDPKRWAYSCQGYILTTRIDQLEQFQKENNNTLKICFVERSIYSGRYCFAQVAQEIGTMNGMEWCLYKKLWNHEIARLDQHDFALTPSAFIYLKTPAEICYNRIMSRGRFEEKPISLDYLKRLEEKYDAWFVHKAGVDEHILNLPTLMLDFSQNFQENNVIQNQYVQLIKEFISHLK